MSELIQQGPGRKELRWQLLASASAIVLLGATCQPTSVLAEDDSRPTVWIELGGQLQHLEEVEQRFVPPFVVAEPRPGPETIAPLSLTHPPRYSYGGQAKITLAPEGSDWRFSASILYGRANSKKHIHEQSHPPTAHFTLSGYPYTVAPRVAQFMDTKFDSHESHTILDFQAGREVGLGLFGSSTVNVGVRFAQFESATTTAFKSNPDWKRYSKYIAGATVPFGATYHSNAASAFAVRSFHGVGPSLSWNATTNLLKGSDSGIALDWGANFAVLFGRQKASNHHQTTALYHKGKYNQVSALRTTLYQHSVNPPDRAHSVVVPNVGGFAGLSFLYANAKVSFGYRADFFFGAMDGGIDGRKSDDRNFYGPYATLSIGLGG